MTVSKPKMVAMIIACAFFMQNLDSTIVATALPQIAFTFKTNPVRLSGVITSYLMASAVFLPISGWLADRYGGALIFRIAIGIFSLGSLLCGLSNGPVELTLARIVQGVGGAMMIPVGRMVLLQSVSRAEFLEAMLYIMVPGQIGQVLGPPVGGWITTYASWRWVFLMNVPIGLIGIILAIRLIENHREAENRPLDWLGFLLTGGALSLVLYAIESVCGANIDFPLVAGLLIAGIALGVLAVWRVRRTVHPIVDLSLLKIPTFAVSFWGGTPLRMGYASAALLLPLLFQVAFGMTAFASGMLIFAVALGNVAMKMVARPILKRVGFRTALLWNNGLVVVSMLLCLLFRHDTPRLAIFAVLFVCGFFQSLQFMSLTTLAYANVPAQHMSSATSLAQMGSQVTNVLGVSLAAVLLQASFAFRGSATLTVFDFRVAFAVMVVLIVLSYPSLRGLPADAGAELSGNKAEPAVEAGGGE